MLDAGRAMGDQVPYDAAVTPFPTEVASPRDAPLWASVHEAVVAQDRRSVAQHLQFLPECVISLDEEHRTPLLLAAAAGDVSILSSLLRRAAPLIAPGGGRAVDVADSSGLTPLHWACMHQRYNAVELLLQHGASINAEDEDGRRPLHIVAFAANPRCLTLLLPYAAHGGIDAASHDGLTPLHYASLGGSEPCVTMLLNARATIDSADEDGRTALSWASSEAHDGVMSMLLGARANPSAPDANGMTPLHHAAKAATVASVQVLLRGGASALKRTAGGMLAEELARSRPGPVGVAMAMKLQAAGEAEARQRQTALLAEEQSLAADKDNRETSQLVSARETAAVRRRKKEARKQMTRARPMGWSSATDEGTVVASGEGRLVGDATAEGGGSLPARAPAAASAAGAAASATDRPIVPPAPAQPTAVEPSEGPRPPAGAPPGMLSVASARRHGDFPRPVPPTEPHGLRTARAAVGAAAAAASPRRREKSSTPAREPAPKPELQPLTLPPLSGGGISSGAHARPLETICGHLSPRCSARSGGHSSNGPLPSLWSPPSRGPGAAAAFLSPARSSRPAAAQPYTGAHSRGSVAECSSSHASSPRVRPEERRWGGATTDRGLEAGRASANTTGSSATVVSMLELVAGLSDLSPGGLSESELRTPDSTAVARWLSGATSEQRRALARFMKHLSRPGGGAAAASPVAHGIPGIPGRRLFGRAGLNCLSEPPSLLPTARGAEAAGGGGVAPDEGDEETVGRMRLNRHHVLGHGASGAVVYVGSYAGKRAAIKMVAARHPAPPNQPSGVGQGTPASGLGVRGGDRALLAAREAELLNLCENEHSHPNVLRLFGYEDDPAIGVSYLALELCVASLHELVQNSVQPAQCTSRRRDLLTKVGLLPPPLSQPLLTPQLRRLFGEMLSAVAHLHRLGILHCKLRPRAVLVNTHGVLKLSGLGLGRLASASSAPLRADSRQGARDAIASDGFDPAEAILSVQMRGGSDGSSAASPELKRAADAFSSGVLVFWTLSGGRHPFGDDMGQRTASILSGGPTQLALLRDQPEAQHLVEAMTRFQPGERLRADQAAEHPCIWSDEQKLLFVRCVADEPSLAQECCPLGSALEWLAPEVFSQGDWTASLHTELVEALQAHRSYRKDSLRDLLRAIRNSDHMQGMSENVQRLLLPRPAGIALYFLPRFPALFWTLYVLVRQHWRGKSVFTPFFQWEDKLLYERSGSGLSSA